MVHAEWVCFRNVGFFKKSRFFTLLATLPRLFLKNSQWDFTGFFKIAILHVFYSRNMRFYAFIPTQMAIFTFFPRKLRYFDHCNFHHCHRNCCFIDPKLDRLKLPSVTFVPRYLSRVHSSNLPRRFQTADIIPHWLEFRPPGYNSCLLNSNKRHHRFNAWLTPFARLFRRFNSIYSRN